MEAWLDSTLDDKRESILLYYLVSNQSSKSGVRNSRNNTLNENFAEWIEKLYSYNLGLLGFDPEMKETNVFQKLEDSDNDFLSYENFSENNEALHQTLKDEFAYPVTSIDSLTEKQKAALKFAKAFLEVKEHDKYSGGKYASIKLEGNNTGFKGYIDTNLTEFTRIINSQFSSGFEERTQSFNQIENKGRGHSVSKNFATGMGDRLVESGYAYYDFYNSAKDNLSLYLNLRESAIEEAEIDPIVTDFEELEGTETEMSFARLGFEELEDLVSLSLAHEGFDTRKTSKSGDYGADVIGEDRNENVVVQVKLNRTSSTTVKAVREASSARDNYSADRAIAATNSKFTPQAKDEAERQNVELWNGSDLAERVEKHGIDIDKDLQ